MWIFNHTTNQENQIKAQWGWGLNNDCGCRPSGSKHSNSGWKTCFRKSNIYIFHSESTWESLDRPTGIRFIAQNIHFNGNRAAGKHDFEALELLSLNIEAAAESNLYRVTWRKRPRFYTLKTLSLCKKCHPSSNQMLSSSLCTHETWMTWRLQLLIPPAASRWRCNTTQQRLNSPVIHELMNGLHLHSICWDV